MDNVPVRVNGAASNERHTAAPNNAAQQKKPKNTIKKLGIIGALLAVLAIVLLAGWMVYRSSMAASIDGSRYQAVFFTNGQVYFGKLKNLNGDYFKLTDVFYLQTKTDEDSNNPQETSTEDGANVQLVKLGSEIHGPEDEMIVSKDQVLFFENLKSDGKVSDSINRYRSENR